MLGYGSFLPEGLLQLDLLGLIRILCMAAGISAGTVTAILTAIPDCGDDLAALPFRRFPAQRQFPACGAGKAFLLRIVLHIFDFADLLLEFLRFLLLVIGRFHEAHLPVFFQIQIVVQTFIGCIQFAVIQFLKLEPCQSDRCVLR